MLWSLPTPPESVCVHVCVCVCVCVCIPMEAVADHALDVPFSHQFHQLRRCTVHAMAHIPTPSASVCVCVNTRPPHKYFKKLTPHQKRVCGTTQG
eukprot:NODE_1178_length_1064_cov_43.761576_g913_i0.p3 GENE.NODE_1178_length_1064_cov_43.761576_g913_i0~~NODE_1178_length_1064_cov_43.761576_g913_i0.p3  ORF type:complete len:95 (-),score=40.87 NODE_1178_length_1064_cov_43.761576_g913_i0:619-903(-)